MLEYLLNFLLGLGIGLIAGLFGVGGGFLIVPTLMLSGLPFHSAVGTSLMCITISSLSSAYTHFRERRVLFRVALLLAAASVPMAVLGSLVSGHLNERLGRALFAILLFYVAYTFSRGGEAKEVRDGNIDVSYYRASGVGAFSGFISGLLGVSGGVLNVPLLHTFVRLPVKYAVGTSSVALFFTSLAAAYTHYRMGQVDISTALAFSPGLILGSLAGAHLVSFIPSRKLKKAFLVLLIVVALKMLL